MGVFAGDPGIEQHENFGGSSQIRGVGNQVAEGMVFAIECAMGESDSMLIGNGDCSVDHDLEKSSGTNIGQINGQIEA